MSIWFIVKPNKRGGLPFIRYLLSKYGVRRVFRKLLGSYGYRGHTKIHVYAVECEDEDCLDESEAYTIIAKVKDLILDNTWTELKVIEKRFKHRYWNYTITIKFVKIDDKEYPLANIRFDEYEPIG